tara:strand:- start:203 stop:523 length:321 start_codon:yes stop_codon:yes gene_type:complete
MGQGKFGRRDLQRFRKVYPGVRKTPRNVLMTEKQAQLETATLTLVNEDSKTYSFQSVFDTIPNVSAVSDKDVNVFIQSVSLTHVTVQASSPFTGNIFLTIVEISGV